jgi:hypothetical protein
VVRRQTAASVKDSDRLYLQQDTHEFFGRHGPRSSFPSFPLPSSSFLALPCTWTSTKSHVPTRCGSGLRRLRARREVRGVLSELVGAFARSKGDMDVPERHGSISRTDVIVRSDNESYSMYTSQYASKHKNTVTWRSRDAGG